MINFYPQKVPFLKAVKILFTRRVWLAVNIDNVGVAKGVQVGYDKPKGALPLTQALLEEQQQKAQQAAQAAQESKAQQVADADETPQTESQARQPQFSTRYTPPPKNRKQRREERRGRN